MKRLLLILSFVICHLATNSVAAQGWPAQYGGVMLQGFYWDSYDDSQWTVLKSQADQLNGTFDLVWLPQSGNCGGTSMGYDDLYWFSNYNSSFGNEQQLRDLINTYRENGIKTIADVVINHRKSNNGWFGFPSETYKGVTYSMGPSDVCGNDDNGKAKTEANRLGVTLGSNDTGEGWDGMRDLDHRSQNVQTIVKAYLDFLKNDLGYAGFRYDMVKGYSASYTGMYNTSAQPEFSVGECWDGTNTIKNWIEGTKVDGQIQSAAFDFQFRYTVRNAMNNGNYSRLAQQNDGNWPLVSSNYQSGTYRRYAVTFVENHDTEKRSNAAQDPLKKDTLAANAYLLAMPGTPCIFLKHWLAYPAEIKAMAAARKTAGINNESSYDNYRSTTGYYANIIKTGGENRLLVVVGNVGANESNVNAAEWTKVLAGYHYAYYLPATMETAYADLPSGTYEGKQQVRLAAVSTNSNAKVSYTLDGEKSLNIVNSGHVLQLATGTHTLSLTLVVDGKEVGTPVVRTYNIKEKESEKPADIPEFCVVNDGEVCAFFEAPATWSATICCWAWTDTPSDNFTYSQRKNWPGVDCTLLGTANNGNKVWKWTWDGTKQNNSSAKQPAKIIFSNSGTPQTADLPFENGGYYTKDGLKGNVITAIQDVHRSTFDVQHSTYDLQGRRLNQTPKKGLYIRDGKKVVLK